VTAAIQRGRNVSRKLNEASAGLVAICADRVEEIAECVKDATGYDEAILDIEIAFWRIQYEI